MNIVVIGAGAAGCFFAIETASALPGAKVTVFDAGPRPLAKLALTGGGKCNLTNTFGSVDDLKAVYPRGAQLMKRALCRMPSSALMDWFRDRGVHLRELEDGRIFPESMDAMEIVHTLEEGMRRAGVDLRCRSKVSRISLNADGRYDIFVNGENAASCTADAVLVACGGLSDSSFPELDGISLGISEPLPSLFGFRFNGNAMRPLAGISVSGVSLKLESSSIRSTGDILFTHNGLSGPAVLRLSSYAAPVLAGMGWRFRILVNWLGDTDQEAVASLLDGIASRHPDMMVSNYRPGNLPGRLWDFILNKYSMDPSSKWAGLGRKGLNRVQNALCNDVYDIAGRETHKEEFVTCGGVSLGEINLNTMESKKYPGLYFAGEVLDVDAVTGGYNLQAAWSTGYVAAHSLINF